MRLYKICITRKVFLSTVLSFAVGICFAQSFMESPKKHLLAREDSTIFLSQPIEYITTAIISPKHDTKIALKKTHILLNNINFYNQQESNQHIYLPNKYNLLKNSAFGKKHLGLYAVSTENSYINLLKTKSIAFLFNYQNDFFCIKTSFIANQYETRHVTTQFGINVFGEYKFSPQWSLAILGTIYNHNPYFSMATLPFIEATSYGGWVKYEGETLGIKLGARKYYDSFQKQWRIEPIITPSMKLSKKIILELPVGPLVHKSMEKLLKKNPNNSPIIIPNFN